MHNRWRLPTDLLSERGDDRTDQQGSEQTLRHGAHSINAIAFCGDNDIFTFEKVFDSCHSFNPFRKVLQWLDRCLDTMRSV